MSRFRRRVVLPALGGILLLAVTEGASWLVITLANPRLDEEIRTTRDILREQSEHMRRLLAPDSTRLLVLDSVLGWRYRANHVDSMNQTNAWGLRSTRGYAPFPRPGVLRVAAFGDSFVYCNEVRNEDAWPTLIETMFRDVEVLNYGVGGYGADQAYLRFLREGAQWSPGVVILGLVPDDLGRLVNVYRRFRSNREVPLGKPRLLPPRDGKLELIRNPLPNAAAYARYLSHPRDIIELGRHDYWYEPAIFENPLYDYSATVRLVTGVWIRIRRRYLDAERLVRGDVFNSTSAAFKIQAAVFDRFADAVRARGSVPLIVLLPDKEAIARARTRRRTVFAPLVDTLEVMSIPYVDLTASFVTADGHPDLAGYFMSGGHYSPLGNRIVAVRLGRAVLGSAAWSRSPVSREVQRSGETR